MAISNIRIGREKRKEPCGAHLCMLPTAVTKIDKEETLVGAENKEIQGVGKKMPYRK